MFLFLVYNSMRMNIRQKITCGIITDNQAVVKKQSPRGIGFVLRKEEC